MSGRSIERNIGVEGHKFIHKAIDPINQRTAPKEREIVLAERQELAISLGRTVKAKIFTPEHARKQIESLDGAYEISRAEKEKDEILYDLWDAQTRLIVNRVDRGAFTHEQALRFAGQEVKSTDPHEVEDQYLNWRANQEALKELTGMDFLSKAEVAALVNKSDFFRETTIKQAEKGSVLGSEGEISRNDKISPLGRGNVENGLKSQEKERTPEKFQPALKKTEKSLLVEARALPIGERVVDLETEWYNQAQTMADLFAKEVGQSRQEYIEKLPQLFSQPEEYKGRLETPVIAETRIALPRMLDIVGILSYCDAARIKDWEKNSFRTPKTPYVTWLHDGTRNINKSVRTVRENLVYDERGGTVYDGIALYLKNPDVLKHYYPDFPGSQFDAGSAPCLDLWDGRPKLCHWTDGACPGFGSVVAGRKIRT